VQLEVVREREVVAFLEQAKTKVVVGDVGKENMVEEADGYGWAKSQVVGVLPKNWSSRNESPPVE